MADPYRYFRIEAGEILEQLQAGLLSLEKGESAPEVIAKLLRLAHTLKGAARVVKQKEIADHSHGVEDLLVPVRDAAVPLIPSVIESCLQRVDAMRAQLSMLSAPVVVSGGPISGNAGAEEPMWSAKTNVEDLDILMDGIAELNVQLGAVRASRSGLERAMGLSEVLQDRLAARRTTQFSDTELGQLRSVADDMRSSLASAHREFSANVDQAARELGQVREAAERLRLVPAASVWGSLERTARDAALSLGKNVRFEARGGDIRLEAELLSQMQRALTQAVRNAVAHGIESPAERLVSKKSVAGVVSVSVSRRDKNVTFSCADDGRGLDLDAVRRSARQHGIAAEELTTLDAAGLARLLLRGGISTAQTVTGVAGRGIGLDLIRDIAHALRGSVTFDSVSGQGATISIEVPVSLSALSVLVVVAAGQVIAFPLGAVSGTSRQRAEDVARTADGDSVLFDGSVVPYASLARFLTEESEGAMTSTVQSAVYVTSESGTVALGVERLMGIESVVARSVPEMALLSPVISGASFDAEGNPRLLLSPEGLLQAVRGLAATPRPVPRTRVPILVIDDSLTTRMLEQSILESAGYEVDLAVSGEEGMEMALRRRYALFLVDVEMPGMDGFTFIEQTRSDPLLRDVPAILVTSRASAEDVQRGRSAGALAHIEKREFNQTDLLERIRKLVS